jgi:hypothetical protein
MLFDHQDLAACAGDGAQLPAALDVPLAEWDRRAEPATALDVPQAFRPSSPGRLNYFFSSIAAAPSWVVRSRPSLLRQADSLLPSAMISMPPSITLAAGGTGRIESYSKT